MRRLLAICVGLLALICRLTIAQVAGPIALVNAQTPETELNDNFETANALDEANISAQIVDGESDLYQIDANTTDALSLKLININGDADVALRLYDSNRDTLNTDDTNRAQDPSVTRKLPEMGTYYMEVDGRFSQTTTDYTFQSNQTGSDSAPETSPQSVVDEYAGEDGEVSPSELLEAVADFRGGQLQPTDILKIIQSFRD